MTTETIPQLGRGEDLNAAQAQALVAVWDAEALGSGSERVEASRKAQRELAQLGGATFDAMKLAQDIIAGRRS